MISGMTTFTFVHVVLSLVGIVTGLIVLLGPLGVKGSMAGRHNFASTVLAGLFDEASLSLRGPSGTQGFRAAI